MVKSIHYDWRGLPDTARGSVAVLGNFDGVHLGHRSLIEVAAKRAAMLGVPVSAVTFDPHPRRFFMKDAPAFNLDCLPARIRRFRSLGVEQVFVLPFGEELCALSAEAFAADVLKASLGLRHVVVGHDFNFGRNRSGTVERLRELGRDLGFGVDVVPAVRNGHGEIYSSTHIRAHVVAGEMREAAAMLGAPWEIEGEVLKGDQRGRTIGFPTANVALGQYVVPRLGVYAVRVADAADETPRWFDGVANIGRRPTFNKDSVLLEAHLFGFSGDLYGRTLRLALIGFLRDERKFAGLDELKAQIAADAEAARQMLAS